LRKGKDMIWLAVILITVTPFAILILRRVARAVRILREQAAYADERCPVCNGRIIVHEYEEGGCEDCSWTTYDTHKMQDA
jgi:hypothetical protein